MITSIVLALVLPQQAAAQVPTDCLDLGRAAVARPPLNNPEFLESANYPVKIWYERNDDQAADIAQITLDTIELSWGIQVDQIGFNPPVTPDAGGPDGDLDVYVVDYAFGVAFVAADSYSDVQPGDGLNSASTYMVIDARLPTGWVEGFAAHEFNHVLQFGYDYSEWTLPIWESTAVAAEKWTLGTDSVWETMVPSFQEAPYFPALLADHYTTYYVANVGYYYQYGGVLWVLHLDEVLGAADGAKGVELWEQTANEGLSFEPDVVDAFAATAGTDLGEALNALAMSRFLVGDDWDNRGLPDAANWGRREMVPADDFTADDLPLSHSWTPGPMITGQTFADLDLSQGALPTPSTDMELWIEVSVTSAVGNDTGVQVMWWNGDGSVGDDGAHGADPVVELPLADVQRLAVGVTNLGAPGWDGDDDSYVPGDQILTVEIAERPVAGTTPTGTTTGTGTGTTPTGTTGTGTTPGTDPTDGGDPVDNGEDPNGGCGCTSAPVGVGWLLVAAPLALAAVRRRS